VTAKGGPLLKKPDWLHARNSELLQQLLTTNAFNREQSRRVLIERGKQILPDVAQWTDSQKTERGMLEGLWMYEALNELNAPLLEKLLRAEDGHVRAAAVRVVSYWQKLLQDPIALLEP